MPTHMYSAYRQTAWSHGDGDDDDVTMTITM